MAQTLSEGEMMVWAAAYVAALARGEEAPRAISRARKAVQYLREMPKKSQDADTRMLVDFLTDPD